VPNPAKHVGSAAKEAFRIESDFRRRW